MSTIENFNPKAVNFYNKKESDLLSTNCVACNRFLFEPYQIECGHRICKECAIVYNGKSCPSKEHAEDDEEIIFFQDAKEEETVRFDKAFQKELGKLKIYCPFYGKNSCQEILLIKDFYKHLQFKCEFVNFSQCPNSIYGCEEKNINRKHLNECKFDPENEVECKYKCGTLIKNKLLKDHWEKNCKNVNCECPLQEIGCQHLKRGTIDNINDHLKNNLVSHMDLIKEYTMESNQGTENLIEDVCNIEEKLKALTKRVNSLENNMIESKDNSYNQQTRNPPVMKTRNSMDYAEEIGYLKVSLSELNAKLQISNEISYTGVMLWRINNYQIKKKEATTKQTLSIFSPPFYTTRFGYKLRARAYLNGDGSGKGTHLSVFIVVFKGEYDNFQRWPFQQRITFTLLNNDDQQNNVTDSFRPDPNSTSFQKPNNDANIACGCPRFIEQVKLENEQSGFLKHDQIVLKILVDTTNLRDP